MPSAVQVQASERVDAVDLRGMIDYPRELTKLLAEQIVLDRQARVLRGFRVQLTDQNTTPGRIVVHCGTAFDRSGRMLINETQGNATRTITLEGASTWFYVELEFVESDAVVDSRAFWDPTVDQGTDPSGDDKPDGQEVSNNVATRKVSDWKIVQPISTSAFERDLNPSSNRVPLIKLKTDASNKITAAVNTGLTTEKAATTLLQQISSNKIRVQNARYMPQVGNSIKVSEGAGVEETVTVSSVDRASGVLGVSTMLNTHTPGDIVRVATSTEPDFITEASQQGRYWIDLWGGIDCRDRIFQGDELHGSYLSRGHSSPTARSSVNLQSLQDYVDFLSAQIQELKWGTLNPYVAPLDAERIPPGLSAVPIPTVPRHYDRAGGLMGSRMAAITVGDGFNSYGDLNGSDETALQAAHDALPAAGGRIFLKRGTYTLYNDLDWTSTGDVVLEGESGTIIELSGGRIHVATVGAITLRSLTIKEGASTPSNIGIMVDTSTPATFTMTDVLMLNAALNVASALPSTSFFTRTYFTANSSNMASIPLIKITGTGGTLSGTFAQCQFAHYSYNALTTALIDCISASPTTSCTNLIFSDCDFGTVWLNAESIHLGNTVNIVQFDKCFFLNLLTLCHVRATGGANVKLTNCVGGDALASFAYLSGMSHVTVDGYLNANSVGLPAVELINCSDAKIMNCDVKVNSGTSLTNAAFKVSANANCKDVEITNNLIHGDTNTGYHKTNGIRIDQTGGVVSYFSNIKISDNTFRTCEVPIYVANSGAASSFYQGLEISNNTMIDLDGYTTVTMKVGILLGTSSLREGVVISNNSIIGLAPATTDTTGAAASRAGICIQGTNNTQFVIEGNMIQYNGHLLYALAETAGIYVVGIEHSTISDNMIKNVVGQNGVGIKFSQSVTYTTISSNKMEAIASTVSGAYGVYAHNLTNVSIIANSISNILSVGVLTTSAIIGSSSSSSSWTGATITGNIARIDAASTSFIECSNLVFERSSVTGNSVDVGASGMRGFFEHNTAAGGYFVNNTITGNAAHGCQNWAIRIDARSGTGKRNLVIEGNNFHVTSTGGAGIQVLGVSYMSVTGNQVQVNSSGDVFYASDCYRFAVTGNVFARNTDAAPNVTINISTNCNYYTVQGNVCDQAGGVTTFSIMTTSAAQTGTARVSDNLVDTNVSVGTDVVAAANTTY